MQAEIYLDNNATTKVAREVLEAITPFFSEHFGNAGSSHIKGQVAERIIFESRNKILKTLGANAHKVIFTSSGTEGDNLAILGSARASKHAGNHIITSNIEHPAVLECMDKLSKEGFKVSYLKTEREGIVNASDVLNEMRENTILVSIMHINNETGAIFPIEEIARAVKAKKPDCIFHSDGVQAVGKVKPDLSQVDLYVISGHKFHAPKGIGALIIREGCKIQPIIFGGGQEAGYRSGTENVPGIVGLTKALELSYEDFDKKIAHFRNLLSVFLDGLRLIDDISINTPLKSTPQTVNVSFLNVSNDSLLNALSECNIYVSTGSACSQKKKKKSGVLISMGLPDELVNTSIRFSFSRYTTESEINKTTKALREIIPKLRKTT